MATKKTTKKSTSKKEETVKLECKILIDEEKRNSIQFEIGDKTVWLRRKAILNLSDSEVEIPKWLADVKQIS